MSAIASLYLMPKDKFDEYCRMAHYVPKSSVMHRRATEARVVAVSETQSADFRNREKYYEKLWNFLQGNSKEPYQYNWSGYVFISLLRYLQEERNIDFDKVTMLSDGSEIQVFDQDFKNKYLQQLDPANFKEAELKTFYAHYNEEFEDQMFRTMAAALSKKQVMQMQKMQHHRKSTEEQFPEAGTAMMDGIRIMHNCLNLVDEKSIAFLYVG